MKKCIMLIFLAMVLLMLAACAEIHAEYAISPDNVVTVKYTIKVDKNKLIGKEEHLDDGIEKTAEYWEKQGMTVTKEQDENTATLTGKMRIQARSQKEAFEELKHILTGEYSPFAAVDFQFAESFFDNKYYLSGKLDFTEIVRKDENAKTPKDLLLKVANAAQSSACSITVTLPGVLKDGNGSVEKTADGSCSATWNIKYGETKEIKLQTLYENQANRQHYGELARLKEEYNEVFYVCIGGGAAALIAIIILVIAKGRRRASKRTSFGV